MTIIQPNKQKFHISLTSAFLICLAIIAVLLNIYFYNNIVNLKYSFNQQNKELQKAQVSNADFKNELYKLLDFSNEIKLALGLNLIKDQKPSYLEMGISVAAKNPLLQ